MGRIMKMTGRKQKLAYEDRCSRKRETDEPGRKTLRDVPGPICPPMLPSDGAVLHPSVSCEMECSRDAASRSHAQDEGSAGRRVGGTAARGIRLDGRR
jgi:hypothetical protein